MTVPTAPVLQADYDVDSGLVVAFIDPASPTPYQATGVAPAPGSAITRVVVETIWPDPYLPAYPALAGDVHVDWDDRRAVLIRRFPDADYSPPAIARAIGEDLDASLALALSATDWAVVRAYETKKKTSTAVAERRKALREWHAKREADLAKASPGDLLDFDIAPPAALWNVPRASTITR